VDAALLASRLAEATVADTSLRFDPITALLPSTTSCGV